MINKTLTGQTPGGTLRHFAAHSRRWRSPCSQCDTRLDQQSSHQHGTHHTPAGTTSLFGAKGNAFGVGCQGPDSAPQQDEAKHLLPIFSGTDRLIDDDDKKTRSRSCPCLSVQATRLTIHPVSDGMDPSDLSTVKTPLSCLSSLSAARLGAVRFAGERPDRQQGLLRQLP